MGIISLIYGQGTSPTLNSANTCCDACTIIHVINVVIKCLNHKCLIIICFDNMLVAFTFICLTSLTRAKCGVRSTLCWKIPYISGSIELFAL